MAEWETNTRSCPKTSFSFLTVKSHDEKYYSWVCQVEEVKAIFQATSGFYAATLSVPQSNDVVQSFMETS